MIYVVVDEPDVENQDQSVYASSLEQKIMTAILPYLNIYPTREVTGTTPETPEETTVPGETNEDGTPVETQDGSPEGGGGENSGEDGEETTEAPTGPSPSYTENYPDGIF